MTVSKNTLTTQLTPREYAYHFIQGLKKISKTIKTESNIIEEKIESENKIVKKGYKLLNTTIENEHPEIIELIKKQLDKHIEINIIDKKSEDAKKILFNLVEQRTVYGSDNSDLYPGAESRKKDLEEHKLFNNFFNIGITGNLEVLVEFFISGRLGYKSDKELSSIYRDNIYEEFSKLFSEIALKVKKGIENFPEWKEFLEEKDLEESNKDNIIRMQFNNIIATGEKELTNRKINSYKIISPDMKTADEVREHLINEFKNTNIDVDQLVQESIESIMKGNI